MSNLALCTSSGESAMYSMKAFTTSAIPLNCESGRDLPKRGTLGGENFPMLKAIHFYRSYLSSGFRARCEMELVCSSRYPYGDFLFIVQFFQTSISRAVCFYGHSSAFLWSQSWITKSNSPWTWNYLWNEWYEMNEMKWMKWNEMKWMKVLVLHPYEKFICCRGCLNLNWYR